MVKKVDCTPEQWAKYSATAKAYYQRNREKRIAQTAAYNKTEKAMARRKAFDMLPEQVEKRRKRDAENGNAYRKAQWRKVKSDPIALAEHYARLRHYRTGMDAATFDALLIMQDNRCAICSKPFELERKGGRKVAGKSYPCADHCHDGGGPRGLLCSNCNTIEGHVRSLGFPIDEYMQRLHDYLLNPPVTRLQ